MQLALALRLGHTRDTTASSVTWLKALRLRFTEALENRKRSRNLEEADAHLLADIGLERHEI